jgi:hypothetical protein
MPLVENNLKVIFSSPILWEKRTAFPEEKNSLNYVLLNVYDFVRREILYSIHIECVMAMKLVKN